MTMQQLKKDLAEIKEAVKPKTPIAQVIICDGYSLNDDGSTNLDSIIQINGLDVSNFTNEEKEIELSKSSIHFYMPKKDDGSNLRRNRNVYSNNTSRI